MLKNYFDVIKKNKIYIYVCIIFCSIVALIFSLTRDISYDTNLVLSVYRVNKQDTKDFQYDNYYAIQSSELVGNSIVGWLETPNVIYEIYDRADLTIQSEEAKKFIKKFRAKQISSHSVNIAFNQADRESSEKIAGSLVDVIKEKVSGVEITDNNNNNSFEVSASDSIISEKKYDPILLTIIGLITGLFVGIGLSFIFQYFKE